MATGWGFLGGIVVGVLVVVDALRRQPGRWILFVRLLAVAHVAIVAELALFPLPVDPAIIADLRAQAAAADPVALNVNLVPWATIGPSVHRLLALRLDTPEVRNLLGNFALLMPLAWYGPILWPRMRGLLWFVATALAFSLSIELLQLAITLGLGYAHATDIDDVIVNASGATLAFIVLWPFRRRRP
jgi:glycopeptide antibiotics resistance protein